MQYHTHDIHIQKESGATVLWVSQRLLMDACPDLSEVYMRKVRSEYKNTVPPSKRNRDILPNTGKAWRWAKLEGIYYFAYDNIPDKHPNHYRSCLPVATDLVDIYHSTLSPVALQKNDFETIFKAALNDNYKIWLHCYNQCSETQKINLARYAAILEAAIEWIKLKNISLSKYDFIYTLVDLIKKYKVPYAPEHVRVLKKKLEQIIEGAAITEIAKLPRAGNSNRDKYNDEEVKAWIMQLRDMGANFTNAYIIRKVQEMCQLLNKPVPGNRWIGYIMQQHNVKYLTAINRFGSSSRFSSQYRGHQLFENALHAGDCWQVDGTRINFIAHKNDEKQQQFLYIVSVRDVHSGQVLGYNYTLTEDRWAVFAAVKFILVPSTCQ